VFGGYRSVPQSSSSSSIPVAWFCFCFCFIIVVVEVAFAPGMFFCQVAGVFGSLVKCKHCYVVDDGFDFVLGLFFFLR